MKYADGTEQLIKSDDSWRTSAAGPIRYDNHYLGETFDARRELSGWDAPSFDAGGWAAARTVPGPAGRLHGAAERAHEPDRHLPAGGTVVREPQPRVYVWDTGQQRAGWGTVKVTGAPAGTPIQIRYAEKLGANGLVSITGFTPAGQIQTDYYIAKGTGTRRRSRRGSPTRASSTCRSPASAGRGAAGRRDGRARLGAGGPRPDARDGVFTRRATC